MTIRCCLLLIALTMTAVQASEAALFKDFTGQPKTVESYAGNGKWLVVMIWAHDCHVCNQEVESYAQFQVGHEDKMAHVLGISLDGQAQLTEAKNFVARHDLPFPNLIGELDATMQYFSTLTGEPFRGTPSILLFGPDGALRAAQAGAVPPRSIEAYIERNR